MQQLVVLFFVYVLIVSNIWLVRIGFETCWALFLNLFKVDRLLEDYLQFRFLRFFRRFRLFF